MYSNIDEAWKTSNDLDKYRKNLKPISRVLDATNVISEISHGQEPEFSENIKESSPNSALFKTELTDLAKLVKKDDGTQCDKLFFHFQSCNECRKKMIEKFTLNTAAPVDQPSLNFPSFKFTESFIDMSKYTDLLKNKNYNNILSIILFGLLVIIILSMLNNDNK